MAKGIHLQQVNSAIQTLKHKACTPSLRAAALKIVGGYLTQKHTIHGGPGVSDKTLDRVRKAFELYSSPETTEPIPSFDPS